MVDPPRYPDTGDDRGAPPGIPRWVKVSGIIVVVLILLVIAMMIISGGEHGPGRHTSSDGAGGRTSSAGVPAELAHSGGGVADDALRGGGHG